MRTILVVQILNRCCRCHVHQFATRFRRTARQSQTQRQEIILLLVNATTLVRSSTRVAHYSCVSWYLSYRNPAKRQFTVAPPKIGWIADPMKRRVACNILPSISSAYHVANILMGKQSWQVEFDMRRYFSVLVHLVSPSTGGVALVKKTSRSFFSFSNFIFISHQVHPATQKPIDE